MPNLNKIYNLLVVLTQVMALREVSKKFDLFPVPSNICLHIFFDHSPPLMKSAYPFSNQSQVPCTCVSNLDHWSSRLKWTSILARHNTIMNSKSLPICRLNKITTINLHTHSQGPRKRQRAMGNPQRTGGRTSEKRLAPLKRNCQW